MAAILNFAIFRNFRSGSRAGALAGIDRGVGISPRAKLTAHWQLDADGRLVCDWRLPPADMAELR